MTDDSVSLGSVNWAATAKLALVRGIAASLVWCVVMVFLLPAAALPGFFIQNILGLVIGAPLFHLLVRGVHRVLGGLPFVGLVCNILLFVTALTVAVGDPIVFLLNRQFPELLGLADFKFINLVPAIFVHG